MTSEEIAKHLVDLSNEKSWPPAAFAVGCLAASLSIIEVAATFYPEDRPRLFELMYLTIQATEARYTEKTDDVHDEPTA